MQNLNKSRAYQHHVSAMPDLHPFGWPVLEAVESVNALFKKRLFAILTG